MAKKGASRSRGLEHWGSIAFIVGLVVAIVLGLTSGFAVGLGAAQGWLVSLLVVLGLIVGLLNIAHHEAQSFVYISTALVVVAVLAQQLGTSGSFLALAALGKLGAALNGVLGSLITFLVPAVVVVSLRAVYSIARH